MATLNYLAYGSNLFPPRLSARIGIRGVLGTIELPGYQLRFNKRGADGSGKCSLQPCHQERAYGVVYQICATDKPISSCSLTSRTKSSLCWSCSIMYSLIDSRSNGGGLVRGL